jgi:hypothetical protein
MPGPATEQERRAAIIAGALHHMGLEGSRLRSRIFQPVPSPWALYGRQSGMQIGTLAQRRYLKRRRFGRGRNDTR